MILFSLTIVAPHFFPCLVHLFAQNHTFCYLILSISLGPYYFNKLVLHATNGLTSHLSIHFLNMEIMGRTQVLLRGCYGSSCYYGWQISPFLLFFSNFHIHFGLDLSYNSCIIFLPYVLVAICTFVSFYKKTFARQVKLMFFSACVHFSYQSF